ncbi:chemotaxis protein MotB [Mariprofundus micogutta]|uniref:Chemotaxis protein MotB n=1 Tax=Mariprofundus micogutta TaxID=1921010 RepID=A0A1L8CKM3_9PROT|nr:flagellar motor protein MotB [Mariprofundus micogutta]GAV19409.1 chemotaxis protein MotB [Mariprofundus micogutta]
MARKKKWPVEYLPNTEAWMTTFADLVSLMLTFFILLISMSTMDKTGLSDIESSFTKAVSVLNAGDKTELQIIPPFEMQKLVSPRELMLAMRQNSHAMMKNSTLEHKVKGVIIKDRLYLRIPSTTLFEKGSAELKEEHVKAIQKLAQMLAISPGKIRVQGHTNDKIDLADSQYADPWQLSLARAASVLHILEDEGVNPARLSMVGYGPSRPVSTEATPFGRSKNRRVEIVVFK